MLTLLLVALVIASGLWVLRSSRRTRHGLLVMCFSLLLVLAWNWPLLARLPDVIRNDTILTLSVPNAWLLFALTLTLSVICACLSILKTRYLKGRFFHSCVNRLGSWLISLVRDLVLTFASFWLALTVLPQLFYLFYRIIIPGLPLQWVIKPLGFDQLILLFDIEQATTLSVLSTGLLFSTLLVAVIWSWLLECPIGKNWFDR